MRGGRSTSNLLMGTCGQCGAYALCTVHTVLAGNRRVETWRCAASSKCRERQEVARKAAEASPDAARRARLAGVREAQEGLREARRVSRVRDANARAEIAHCDDCDAALQAVPAPPSFLQLCVDCFTRDSGDLAGVMVAERVDEGGDGYGDPRHSDPRNFREEPPLGVRDTEEV
jgi:hypothetical protein